MNQTKTIIYSLIIGILIGFLLGMLYIHYTTNTVDVKEPSTEVEDYRYNLLIKELDSLKKIKQTVITKDSLITKKIYETKYVPLSRPIITDSLSKANIRRFYRSSSK